MPRSACGERWSSADDFPIRPPGADSLLAISAGWPAFGQGGDGRMKIRTLVLVATAASVTLLVPAAHGFTAAGPLTTEPDVYTNVDVTITDSKITLSQNDFDRGDGVDFRVRNIGKKVHSFALVAEGSQVDRKSTRLNFSH